MVDEGQEKVDEDADDHMSVEEDFRIPVPYSVELLVQVYH